MDNRMNVQTQVNCMKSAIVGFTDTLKEVFI